MSNDITIYDPLKAGIATVAEELGDLITKHIPVLVAAVKSRDMPPDEALSRIRPILRDRVVPIRTGIDKIRKRANEQYRQQIDRNDAYAKELQAQHAKTEMPIQLAISQIESVKAGIEAEEREAAEAKLKAEAEAKAEAERQRIAALEAEIQRLRAEITETIPTVAEEKSYANLHDSVIVGTSATEKKTDGAEVLHMFAARLAAFMEAHTPKLPPGPHLVTLNDSVMPLMRRAYLILKGAE